MPLLIIIHFNFIIVDQNRLKIQARLKLLIRYGSSATGKRVAIARIYTKEDHGINKSLMDKDAVKITQKLSDSGYDAYIVGGAVRDLLLNKKPKDFDISTNALPGKIKKIFWNARIIGRRFRLVHMYYPNKLIEVSTFRSESENNDNNVYGQIEDDVKRRDFTINALYYDPGKEYIIDFIDGWKDIQHKKIRSLIPLSATFIEDPVRMIRAIKYSGTTGFTLSFLLAKSIKKYASELKRCSSSRMTEEVMKILATGASAQIFLSLLKFNLLRFMLPEINSLVLRKGKNKHTETFIQELTAIDNDVKLRNENQKGRFISALVSSFINFPDEYENTTFLFRDTFKDVKRLISPITPPNHEVEMAVVKLFRKEGIVPPKNAIRRKKSAHDSKYPKKSHERIRHQRRR
jgi:poly(A) polymerase